MRSVDVLVHIRDPDLRATEASRLADPEAATVVLVTAPSRSASRPNTVALQAPWVHSPELFAFGIAHAIWHHDAENHARMSFHLGLDLSKTIEDVVM